MSRGGRTEGSETDPSRSLREMSVEELIALVAARTSVPAGGAVAALTTALAAGLAGMAGRFSEASGAEAQRWVRLVARADALRQSVEPLVDEDAESYAEFLAAVRAPRDGRPEARRDRIEEARSRTVDIPLATAEIAAECAVLAGRLAAEGSRTVRGDAATAVLLCHATALATAVMVAENLRKSPDDPRVARARIAARTAAEASERAQALFDVS